MEKNKKGHSKIYIVIYVVLLLLLVYNSTLIIQSIIFPNKTPSFLGIKTYVIVSGSMRPELNIGDIAIVKQVEETTLNTGDIISFREGQSVITHRIDSVQKTDNDIKYQTKGDNNNTTDQNLVKKNNIEGKMIGKIPYLGYLLILLQNKYIIITFIVIYYILTIKSLKK